MSDVTAPHAGDRVDRFTLIEPIGEGGQSTVWRALDPLENVERALKLSRGKMTEEAFERARREAHALAEAPHPNLVGCYGLFEDIAKGYVGLVLELVSGDELNNVASDPRMTDKHRSALLLQLAEAIAHIHSNDLVHRDLKPENVLVTKAFWDAPNSPGAIKVVDFGIAVRIGNPRPLTVMGQMVGTTPYLAPEVIEPRVAPDGGSGFARDLFAYGVLAYELLVGKYPTGLEPDANPVEIANVYAQAVRGDIPWPPPGLPASWVPAVTKCLAILPEDRPESGIELLELVLGRMSTSMPTSTATSTSTSTSTATSTSTSTSVPGLTAGVQFPGGETSRSTSTSIKPRDSVLQRKRGSTIGLALSFGLLAFACVVVFGGHFVKSLFGETTAKTNEPPPMPSIVPPVVDSAPSPTPIASGCPATCCGGTSCVVGADNSRSCGPSIAGHCRACSSGRSCVPGACESRIDASATWLLRIAGVTQNGKDIYPRPDICMRVTGTKDWTCTPGGNADPKATRLKITTTELTSAGIDIRIEKKPKEEVSGTGISHAQVGVAALCKGLNFRFTGADKGAYAATLFLDDEE